MRDEGFLAYGAVRALEGQVPNRDFVSLQAPFSFYSTALMFRIFGISLVTLRAFGLCVYILVALLVYAVARGLTRPVCTCSPISQLIWNILCQLSGPMRGRTALFCVFHTGQCFIFCRPAAILRGGTTSGPGTRALRSIRP
jgi:hypothetical protein